MITLPESMDKVGKFQESVVPRIKNGAFFKTIDPDTHKKVIAWNPNNQETENHSPF